MSATTLSGAIAPPASGSKPKQLIVFLHGVGADGNDLISLAPYFANRLPDAEFISPNAPFRYDMAPMGYQWFSLRDMSAAAIMMGVQKTAAILDGYLDEELAERGLTDADLALVGFSQGTMMSLHVGLRRANPCAAIVGFSGRLPGTQLLAAEIRSRPPVLLIHGEDDPVLPIAALAEAEATLRALEVPVTTMSRPALGHSIDPEGLRAGIAFVVSGFGE